MILRRVVVGVLFNTKNFKVDSRAGEIVDKLVDYSRKQSERGGLPFFSNLLSSSDLAQSMFRLYEPGGNSIEVSAGQILFKRISVGDGSSLNLDKVIQEFREIYKIINKELGGSAVRRLGLIGESLILEEGVEECLASSLVGKISKFKPPRDSSRFHLNFTEREGMVNGGDVNSADYWNYHIGIYNSEVDEAPLDGGVVVSIDTQRYYNPAKRDAVAELAAVVSKYRDRKLSVRRQLIEMGVLNG